MIKFTPIILAVIYALLMYRFSVWRTQKELDAKSSRLVDPTLRGVLDRLARAQGVDDIPVHVYEVDPVNGLAAPDGRIFITRGFYQRFRQGAVSAEELASVFAHELGHVALGHARKRMIDFSGQNALRIVLMTTLGRFIPFFGIMLANFITGLLAARLSRDDEYAADEYASALMIKAGFGTAPQKSLFTKLESLTKVNMGAAPAWLLSHPKTTERIAAIERNEARWGLVP